MENYFSEDSPFIVHDTRKHRWAVPYHVEAVNIRGTILLANNRTFISGKTILDLGCHFGTWSMLALKLAARHVTGLDSDPKLISHANALFSDEGTIPESYTFMVGNVMDILKTLPDKCFDTILCLGLLYYLPDPYSILREMKRIAREAIILDTFTASYCAIQGKDSPDILSRIKPETFELPLLFHSLTQSDKQSYHVPHIVRKTDTNLTILTCPTQSLLELYAESLSLSMQKLDWTPFLKNPTMPWQELMSHEA
ncbi:MAG: class I SAM-dependent methyltransferase, partial [Candidatus Margulisiibacteriota bacterium]